MPRSRVPRVDDRALARLRTILAARPAIAIDAPKLKRAAVLIPLVPNGGGWSLLFSRRSANLAAHSGQIAFPGGGVEAGEPLEAAAIRAAHGEGGKSPGHIEMIWRLEELLTNNGFLIAPFVGVVDER